MKPTPHVPIRLVLTFAAAALAVALWISEAAVALGVIRAGWPIPFHSIVLALAISATVATVQLGISHTERMAAQRERQEITAEVLAAIRENRRVVTERLNSVEWEVLDRTPTGRMDDDEDTVPINSNVRMLNGRR